MSNFDDKSMGLEEIEEGHEVNDSTTLQMLMTNSSFGHEYARKELEQSTNFHQTEELLEKMEYFRKVYFQAREALVHSYPEKLDDIEKDLLTQKQAAFTDFTS